MSRKAKVSSSAARGTGARFGAWMVKSKSVSGAIGKGCGRSRPCCTVLGSPPGRLWACAADNPQTADSVKASRHGKRRSRPLCVVPKIIVPPHGREPAIRYSVSGADEPARQERPLANVTYFGGSGITFPAGRAPSFPFCEIEMGELVRRHRIIELAVEGVVPAVEKDRHEIGLVGNLLERLGIKVLALRRTGRRVGRLEPRLDLRVAGIIVGRALEIIAHRGRGVEDALRAPGELRHLCLRLAA